MKFSIAIEPGTDRAAFGVVVPDLPGCFSAGDTAEEAFDNTRAAIEAHVEILAEEGGDLPDPRPLDQWQKDPQYQGWTWGIVDVPVEKLFGPAEKINITVPALLLKRIDEYSERTGNTRSGFLTEAAVAVMKMRTGESANGYTPAASMMVRDRADGMRPGTPSRGRAPGAKVARSARTRAK
ncbi:MAG TPA: type II toxin-antitoxin system HicB family antitoxin [Steroidobacteraceae bacterium]|nr:type II toxin-antitoxin system HicB family antitoxin [Steroidobacteraceae bacterium]